MEQVLTGDIEGVIRATGGSALEFSLESDLRACLARQVLASLQSLHLSHSRFAPLKSRILTELQDRPQKSVGERPLLVSILLLSRFAVHFIKGCAVGVGMYCMEWWIANRIHALLRIPPRISSSAA